LLTIFLSQVSVFLSQIYTEVPQFCSAPSERIINKIQNTGWEGFVLGVSPPLLSSFKKIGGENEKGKIGGKKSVGRKGDPCGCFALKRSTAAPHRRSPTMGEGGDW